MEEGGSPFHTHYQCAWGGDGDEVGQSRDTREATALALLPSHEATQVVEPGHKLLFTLKNHVPCVHFKQRKVLGLYGNKTCLKIWNSAVVGLFFWYLYFHMLNDLYMCWINKYFEFSENKQTLMVLKCVSSLAMCPNFCFAAKVETCLYSECNDFLYRGSKPGPL